MALPPGPTDLPALQLARWIRAPIPFMNECARKYGEAFTVRFPRMGPVIMFSNPSAIKDIFTTDPEEAHAGEANLVLRSILGENSLLLLDGKRHIRERKMMMPPFHGERMREYGAAMRDATVRRIEAWPRGKPFPIHTETQAITLDVILETVFGFEGAERARMSTILTRFVDLGTSPLGTLMLLVLPPDVVEKLLQTDGFRVGPVDVARLLPWTPLVRAGKDVDESLYEILRQRRASADTERRRDVLSMLLSARDEHGKPMSDVELRDEMMTLLLASHETTATTLAWTVHFVLKHPQVHAKILAEIDRVRGDRPLSIDDIPRLEYLDATIKESMRLLPIISLIGRRLQKPLRIGGWDLDRGDGAVGCIHLTHRNPAVWRDPDRFEPERFLTKKPTAYEWFPFGGGTRRCLGMAFAMYEMRIVLAEIFSRCVLRAAPADDVVPVRRGITLAPKGGVLVSSQPR
ncbi:MAG: cytochrome P450 [Polyangiales bacterium]